MTGGAVLVLRLAGPLQSWGSSSRHNRRATNSEPTKSGVVGLLAAAQGRRRTQPIDDLAGLDLAVRIDQPGRLRRDFHTASRPDGRPLPSAAVSVKGAQKPTGPAKNTHVTERFYLEEAVFVVAVQGPQALIALLADAVRRPAFPLALGRRSCVPTQPVLVARGESALWPAGLLDVLQQVPWQVSERGRAAARRSTGLSDVLALPVVLDDPHGEDLRDDLPLSFHPQARRYASRRVSQRWVEVPTGLPRDDTATDRHDPFALLGW